MTEKKLLFIVKSPPYTTLNYYEALRTAIGAWEHEVRVLWTGDGVYALLREADHTLTKQFLADIPDLDIELYVDSESLQARGLDTSEILDNITPLDEEGLTGLLSWAEASLAF